MDNEFELMKNVYFKPWVGKFYEKDGCFNKRVMILGDSHYCGESCFEECGKVVCKKPTITSDVINDFISSSKTGYFEPFMNTFTHFERAVFNKELSQQEKETFWNSVVFYNYLQRALAGPGIVPDSNLYAESFDAFKEVIEMYKPEVIIAWGIGEMRLFRQLPEYNGKQADPIIVDNEKYNFGWIYYLQNGQEVKVYGVKHPSMSFEREYWSKIISAALVQ